MDATDVFNVAKALSQDEYHKLFAKIEKDIFLKRKYSKKNKTQNLTNEDAIRYLMKNVFNKPKIKL